MNLKIDIPEDDIHYEPTLDQTIQYLAERRGIIPQDLYSIYNQMTPSDKTFFNDKEFSPSKTKREYATFQMKNNQYTASCRFTYYTHDNCFTKVYIYDDDTKKNIVLAKILCEIYFQQHAMEFNGPSECNFLVPNIYSYGFIQSHQNKEQLVFYFTMEHVNATTIEKFKHTVPEDYAKYMISKAKSIEIDDCLKCNGFYHNDLHSNNIMISNTDNKIYIIDYGESSKIENNLIGFNDHIYCIGCSHTKKYTRICF